MKNHNLKSISETVARLVNAKTGLNVVLEFERANTYKLVVMAREVKLGFTTVTQKIDGGFIIGGLSGGCFMQSSDSSLRESMAKEFRALENELNGEE